MFDAERSELGEVLYMVSSRNPRKSSAVRRSRSIKTNQLGVLRHWCIIQNLLPKFKLSVFIMHPGRSYDLIEE